MNHLIILLSIISIIDCIWPPEYKIELKQEEEFIISEPLSLSDVQDIYDEEELIRKDDLKLSQNNEKYFRLHGLLESKKNSLILKNQPFDSHYWDPEKTFPETNGDLEEANKPWIAGFVDGNSNTILKDEDTIYFDDDAKTIDTKLEKRDVQDYNYANLKAQYDDAVKKAAEQNDTLKYKDVKEEETAQEAVQTLMDVTPKNCTEEEKSGLGLNSLRCFWKSSSDKYLDKQKKFYMLKKVVTMVIIWVIIYLLIALPLWCQYGWCCCCFRCKFCHPRDEIEEIKTFFANNPPGVYHDDEGNLKKYKPTPYEIYAEKNLEKAIQKL